MEVRFSPEQETQLARIALVSGIDSSRLVQNAALQLVAEDAHFCAEVREGVVQADRAEFIEEDEMHARFAQMLKC